MNAILEYIASITQDVKEIREALQYHSKSSLKQLNEEWIDGQIVLQTLHISQRTLQSLRDNGTLPFSRINGKFYYKVSDIQALLESNYTKSKMR
jgi:hypothetical protein